jgi:hypothetical protein
MAYAIVIFVSVQLLCIAIESPWFMHSYMSMSPGSSGSVPPLPCSTVPREAAGKGGEDYVHYAVKFLSHMSRERNKGLTNDQIDEYPYVLTSSSPQSICSSIYLVYPADLNWCVVLQDSQSTTMSPSTYNQSTSAPLQPYASP